MGEDWTPLRSELSQGDIFLPIPLGVIVFPVKPLKRISLKRDTDAWTTMDPRGLGKDSEFLATGKQLRAMVVSYDCEIQETTRRILCAPIAALQSLEAGMQVNVKDRKVFSKFPLLGVPGVGDCYADFGSITAVNRNYLPHSSRLASMSDGSVEELKAALIAFFTRYKLP